MNRWSPSLYYSFRALLLSLTGREFESAVRFPITEGRIITFCFSVFDDEENDICECCYSFLFSFFIIIIIISPSFRENIYTVVSRSVD